MQGGVQFAADSTFEYVSPLKAQGMRHSDVLSYGLDPGHGWVAWTQNLREFEEVSLLRVKNPGSLS